METSENLNFSIPALGWADKNAFQSPTIATILIVDDTPICRMVMTMILSSPKYRIDTAKDGCEALAMIKKSNWDYSLVITDHNMPHMSGLELTKALRNSPFKGKICVSSSAPLHFLSATYSRYYIDAIQRKPVDSDKMRDLVERLVESIDHTAELNTARP